MEKSSIIIRVDGNSTIGLGHIYRGIALAEMLNDDFDIVFITRQSSTIAPAEEAGLSINFLPEQLDILEEPRWFNQNYDNNNIIICDGYEFKTEYQKRIKEFGFKLVYVDDLAAWHMYADVVINHSPGAKKNDYSLEIYTKLGLGLKYAIIRKDFIENNGKYKREKNSIFVSFGGADPDDFTFKTLRELVKVQDVNVINVVLGRSYIHKKLYKISDSRIKIFQGLSSKQMIDVINNSGVAIVSASTISIELAYSGLPMLIGYYVDNQKGIYEGFVNGYGVSGLGDFHAFCFKDISEKLSLLLNQELPESCIKIQQNIGNNLFNVKGIIKNA